MTQVIYIETKVWNFPIEENFTWQPMYLKDIKDFKDSDRKKKEVTFK